MRSPPPPVPENSPAADVPCRGDRPSVREDAGGSGILRRGEPTDRTLRITLARALRLLRAHVRCTCDWADSQHRGTCAIVKNAHLEARAQEAGVDLTYGCPESDPLEPTQDGQNGTQREVFARGALRVLGAVLLAVLVAGCSSPGEVRIDRLEVEVHGHRAGLEVEGVERRSTVGDTLHLLAWPTDAAGVRLPGYVTWSLRDGEGRSAYVAATSDTTSVLVPLRPGRHVLVAEVYPYATRPEA